MADDGAMNTETSSEQPPAATPRSPRMLVRPVEGRRLGGVAIGVANYLSLPLGLIRFLFVVFTILGGVGLVLYAAGWLFIRDETEHDSVGERLVGRIGTGPAWIGAVLIVVALLITLDNVTILSGSLLWATALLVAGFLLYRGDINPGNRPRPPADTQPVTTAVDEGDTLPTGNVPPAPPPVRYTPPPPPPTPPSPPSILGRLTIGIGLLTLGVMALVDNLTALIDPRPRHYMAVATVALGSGLIIGGFVGRARWMILLGIFVIPPLVASPAAEFDWREGIDRLVAPQGADGLADSYSLTAGSYRFDLTDVDWEGRAEQLSVEVAAGEILVMVPPELAVTGTARVAAGEIVTPADNDAGVGNITQTLDLPGTEGTIEVDLRVGGGSIRIMEATAPLAPVDGTDLRHIQQDFGDVEIDLRNLGLTEESYQFVQVGTGDVEVMVPPDLDLTVLAFTGNGRLDVLGTTGGSNTEVQVDEVTGDGPILNLEIIVGRGDVTVIERSRG